MKGFETLLGLLNKANVPPKEFTTTNLRVGVPVEDAGAAGGTKIMVEGIPGFGYYNEVEVEYRRVPLTEYLGEDAVVRSITPLTKDALMVQLNAVYDLELTLDDLEDFEIPPVGLNESATITLTAKNASIGFKGIQGITYTYGRPLLEQVITNRDLAQLRFVIPDSAYKSALHMTWGKDWTSVRDAIKPNKDRLYSDWDALQAACQFFGIPAWVQGHITDTPTSGDPLANPAFDRVVIQRTVSSSGMIGDLYFHYNLFDEV